MVNYIPFETIYDLIYEYKSRIIKCTDLVTTDFNIPTIWVERKAKNGARIYSMITEYTTMNTVIIGNDSFTMKDLLKKGFTFMDGTPMGIKVDERSNS